MRIHTSLTRAQMLETVRGLPGVAAEVLTEQKSATHPRAFELILTGNGRYGTQYGNNPDVKSATWDEWGTVMGRIFDADPSARMGGTAKRPIYADAYDYHWQTDDRFADGVMPTDTHPVHRWDFTGTPGQQECKKCSAVRRWRR